LCCPYVTDGTIGGDLVHDLGDGVGALAPTFFAVPKILFFLGGGRQWTQFVFEMLAQYYCVYRHCIVPYILPFYA